MDRIKKLAGTRDFWIIGISLAICTFFHYYSPQTSRIFGVNLPMTRQAIVRIIFLLPVAAAAFAFGRSGGLVSLGIAVLVMLPRAIFLSPQPIDAFFEIVGIAIVGYIIVWMIDTQEKEKRLRQRAVEELETVNAIALTLTQPYDLGAMLEKALARTLEAIGSQQAKGAIFLLDPWAQMLTMRAHQGLSLEFVARAQEIPLRECLCGQTAETGSVLVVRDALKHPQHTRCLETQPHSHVCIPLKARDRLLGVIDFCLPYSHPVDAIDREMFAAIGRQIGVAVENARLCENLRFYVRQISDAQEDERRRIARELHDDTAQGLIDLSRRLDNLAATDEGLTPFATKRLEEILLRIENLLEGVRRYGRDLRPSVLDDLGLLPALESLMAGLEQNGVEPRLETRGDQRRLSPEAELALYRIVQEALNNIRKHANASHVRIVVEFSADRVRVSVQDDGQGFEMPATLSDLATLGRFGFVGIHERVQLLRGTLTVRSEIGEGMTVVADVPA
jgi:signal transduction histidine kinase